MSAYIPLELDWRLPGVDSNPAGPALKEFKLFTSLPYELRLKIWTMAVPGSNLVETKLAERSKTSASPFVINTTKSCPVLLQICRESRAYFLTNFSLYVPSWYGVDLAVISNRPRFLTFSLKSEYESVYVNYDGFFQRDYWIARLGLLNLRQRLTFYKVRILEIRKIDFENVLRDDQFGFSPPSFQFLTHFTRLTELCIKGPNLFDDGDFLFGGWQDDTRMYQIAVELSEWLKENSQAFNNGIPVGLHYLMALKDIEELTADDDGNESQLVGRCACGKRCRFFEE